MIRLRDTHLFDRLMLGQLTILLLLLCTSGHALANDPQTMAQRLRNLDNLYFVKQSIQNQAHKGSLTKITSAQAIKTIRSANPALGFEYSERVQEYLDMFTAEPNRKGTEIMLGLAAGYLSLFESYLIEEKLPADLMYLPLALSALNTKSVSTWGASGLWQIMYTNGRLYQLQIDSYIDERRDPAKATRAALHHLKDLYSIYSNWELAVIAYTNSPSNLNKAIRKAGGSKKSTDLYTWLPPETRDLLPAFTACYILMHNYEKTGLKPYEIQNPAFYLRTPVEKRLHLGQVAEVMSIPLDFLMDMNPEYKTGIVPAGTQKTYWIKLPPDKHHLFADMADSIHQFKDSIYFPARRAVIVSDVAATIQPESNTAAHVQEPRTQTPTPPQPSAPSNKTKLTYTVKDGDNLGYISQWYNVSVADIRSWNNLRGDVIKVGQLLDIWVPENSASRYTRIDAMSFAEKQAGGTTTQSAAPAKPAAPQTPKPTTGNQGSFTWYTVKSGETITGIASRYPGITADEIMALNNIKDPRSLQVGQKIKIPKK
jgi:membrane-bound lytic murein transglycosylase D